MTLDPDPTPIKDPTSLPLVVPVAEPIPIGFATKVGSAVTAIFGFIALLTSVLHGDHSEETVTSLVLGAVTVFVVLGGRYAQATLAQLARRW